MKHTVYTVPVGCETWWELRSKLHPSQFSNGELWCYPAGPMVTFPDPFMSNPGPNDWREYRLTNSATNAWIGVIETMNGDEVLDLTAWAVDDFQAAFKFAQEVVRKYNKERFNTTFGGL